MILVLCFFDFGDWNHLPYVSDHKAHLNSFNFLKNQICPQGRIFGGWLGRSPPLKPKELTLFIIILYNPKNKIRGIRPFRQLLFCHNSFDTSSLLQ